MDPRLNQLARFPCLGEVDCQMNVCKIRERFGPSLDHNDYIARLDLLAPQQLDAIPAATSSSQFSTINRQANIGKAFVAGDDLSR